MPEGLVCCRPFKFGENLTTLPTLYLMFVKTAIVVGEDFETFKRQSSLEARRLPNGI